MLPLERQNLGRISGDASAMSSIRNRADPKALTRRSCAVAAAIVGFGALAALAADPNQQPGADKPDLRTITPPLSGTTSSDLARSGGVIAPAGDVDPQMNRSPPASADPMPVVPPPGTPGGDPSIKPK